MLGIAGRHVAPGEDAIEPALMFAFIFLYALAANGAYTLGWITEWLWSGGEVESTKLFRKRAFYLGLAGSVALTLAPGMLALMIWAIGGFR